VRVHCEEQYVRVCGYTLWRMSRRRRGACVLLHCAEEEVQCVGTSSHEVEEDEEEEEVTVRGYTREDEETDVGLWGAARTVVGPKLRDHGYTIEEEEVNVCRSTLRRRRALCAGTR